MKKRLNAIRKERDKIQRAWIKNMMSDDDLSKYQNELDDEQLKIENELVKLNKDTITVTKEEVAQLVEYFNAHFEYLTYEEKRLLIQRHVKEIRFQRELKKGCKQRYNVWVENIIFF